MPLLSLARHRVCHPRAVVRASVRHASPAPSPGRASRTLPAAAAAAAVLGLGAYYLLRPDPPRGAPTSSTLPLARTHFTPARVLSSEATSPDTRVLTLQLPPAAAHPPEGAAPVWSVLVKDADIMLERPFTPLRGVSAGGTLELWVKAYPGGEVGRWLHARAPGDVVELRGPVQTLAWPFGAGDWDEVVLVCAPALCLRPRVLTGTRRYPAARASRRSSSCCTTRCSSRHPLSRPCRASRSCTPRAARKTCRRPGTPSPRARACRRR
jgi:hypothetical protein